MSSLFRSLVSASVAGFSSVAIVAAASPKTTHFPQQPKSGEPVRVSAQFEALASQGVVTLQYQTVDPGGYIALKDSEFQKKWSSVPMTDDGRNGDVVEGDNIFTVEVPGNQQTHRRLVRYRVALGNKIVAPAPDETVPNFGYFVYDGVPPWSGAINPKSSDPKLRGKVAFGTNVMRSLPVYQLISKKSSVENVTWYEQAQFGDEEARKRYNYTGTFVADDGKVYDHVRFRARGGQWRYAMGKNMWKMDFPRGHHLQARDDFGQSYKSKWEKLNLGACIQQASSRYRGEHGMFEAVGFRLFNLTGVEAPRTHWVHFRIIKDAQENPDDQYDGDFWGLYLATEDIDDSFLKEHNLPSGNLYKMDFGRPRLHNDAEVTQGNENAINSIGAFLSGIRRARDEQWWRQNVDLPRYYSYRSIVECIHHYDIYAGKNYFFYHNDQSRLWSVLPWDIDLTWADNMHGNGAEPFYQSGLLSRRPFAVEYQNRLREIRDLLFCPEQMDALIDEYAALISDPRGGPSFVDADRAKWDYHPIMASRHVTSKAMQGEFYKISPTGDFRGMVQLMKNYVRSRGEWIEQTLLPDQNVPAKLTVKGAGALDFSGSEVKFRASAPRDGSPMQGIRWRLAEVTTGTVRTPDRKTPKFEITGLWETSGTSEAGISTSLLKRGSTYRVRALHHNSAGQSSHWSDPVEFRVPGLVR